MRDYYRGQVKGINTPKPRWAYGDKFKVGGRVYIVLDDAYTEIDEYRKVGLFGFIEVVPETVGQDTGKKDDSLKHRKIYEGDIILCGDYVPDAHAWNEWKRVVGWDKDGLTWIGLDGERNIVIGNITDNPEQLG